MSQGYVPLMRFGNMEEAEFYKELLEDQGVFAVITDERFGDSDYDDAFAALPRPGGWIRLQVPEEDSVRAGQILAEDFNAVIGNKW